MPSSPFTLSFGGYLILEIQEIRNGSREGERAEAATHGPSEPWRGVDKIGHLLFLMAFSMFQADETAN
jgi:hypothetical protein